VGKSQHLFEEKEAKQPVCTTFRVMTSSQQFDKHKRKIPESGGRR
jgi:hypothetical protein